GVPMVIPQKLGTQIAECGRFKKNRVNSERAGEDGGVVGDPPFVEFFADAFRRITGEKTGEALAIDAGVFALVAFYALHTLVQPARNVLTQEEQHTDLCVAPRHNTALQLILLGTIIRYEAG